MSTLMNATEARVLTDEERDEIFEQQSEMEVLLDVWEEELDNDEDGFRDRLAIAWTFMNTNAAHFTPPHLPTLRLFHMFKEAWFHHDVTEPITVYRGCDAKHICRPSWTTNPDVAAYFADTFSKTGLVWKATVEPRHILAVFDEEFGLDECEVIVSPFCKAVRDAELYWPDDWAESEEAQYHWDTLGPRYRDHVTE